MHRSEQPRQVEKENELPKIRAFLQIQTDNARYAGQLPYMKHELGRVKILEEALADFDKGDYKKAIAILEARHRTFRMRADEGTDPEGIPAFDNARANEIAAWIDILNELPETGQ